MQLFLFEAHQLPLHSFIEVGQVHHLQTLLQRFRVTKLRAAIFLCWRHGGAFHPGSPLQYVQKIVSIYRCSPDT